MLPDRLLVITMSRTAPFDDDAQAMWNAIKAGVNFTAGEGV